VSYDITYDKFIYATQTFVGETVVRAAASAVSFPVIARDNILGHLYVFWETTDIIYYDKYDGAGWAGRVTWVDESTDLIWSYSVTCSVMRYGRYIGVLYLALAGSPYSVRFAYLSIGNTLVTDVEYASVGVPH
jgi:hypothetical protein